MGQLYRMTCFYNIQILQHWDDDKKFCFGFYFFLSDTSSGKFPYESWYYLLERYDRALLLIIYLILFDNCWKFSCLVYRFGSFCHQFWHKILPKFPRNGIFFVWMISILSTLCKRPYTFNLFLIYLEKNVKILQKKKSIFTFKPLFESLKIN